MPRTTGRNEQMRVLLVRHGQTDWNENGVFRGRIDVKLNDLGYRQAEQVANVLKNVRIDALYSSPLSRALDTAEAVSRQQDLQVHVHEAFNDMNFGEWQGLTRPEVEKRYTESFRVWLTAPQRAVIPNGETLAQVRRRLLRGLAELHAVHAEETVLLVSHGLTNKVLLCAMLGLYNAHFWKVKQDNAAINVFKYTGLGSKVFLMNHTTHLKSMGDIVEEMKRIENPIG
jgi:alpha-ribazole phosphatase